MLIETPADNPSAAAGQARAVIVGAIDIGANAIRMAIAQVLEDGCVEMLEQLHRAARLGQDTFRRGRLGRQTMRTAVAILRDYRKRLEFYNVRHVRAVATSAVREANNADTFLDRVLIASGLDVAVIDTAEEARCTVSALQPELEQALGKDRAYSLVADVGGGSALLTALHKGEIAATQSLRLGSIRLQESLGTTNEPPDRAAEIILHQIWNVVAAVRGSLPLARTKTFIAVGGDARFAARRAGARTVGPSLTAVSAEALGELVRQCQREPADELAKRFGLPLADAETLTPALMVYQGLMDATQAEEMLVSQVSMRDGLVLDLARLVTGQEDPLAHKGVIHSATAIAEKYRADMKHARHVARLAARLFHELQDEHGLGPRHELLLHAAALVHEIGGFVSSRGHHKHSYYLVSNSEIFGLTRDELHTVAHVARYHRRSCPRPSHVEYVALPREQRVVVSKLAALLRVADALDHTHAQSVRTLHCERHDDELVILVPGQVDLTLERRALAIKADLFKDIFCLRVRLEGDPGANHGANGS